MNRINNITERRFREYGALERNGEEEEKRIKGETGSNTKSQQAQTQVSNPLLAN